MIHGVLSTDQPAASSLHLSAQVGGLCSSVGHGLCYPGKEQLSCTFFYDYAPIIFSSTYNALNVFSLLPLAVCRSSSEGHL